MTDSRLPPGLRRRSDLDAIREDVEPYVGTTVAERVEIQASLCRLAAEQIDAHPKRREILNHQDPRSATSLALWRKLLERAARRP